MIYFAQLANGAVKIGCAVKVLARVSRLRTELGCPIVVLATITGGKPREREVHEKFSHLRLGTSEQFQPGDDLMDFIHHPHVRNYHMIKQLPIRHMGTKPTQLRLTREDLDLLEKIRQEEGLGSLADAIRFAGRYALENSREIPG